ncbi:hypothetical protein HYPSUDRAFT_206453 [Hypholoma sublateritium FD-334 SS-4]|uniref:Uncharacterized protein n=1 Tax=Hypholoma sublateritium (strain FD-334 SS-4) TaxID=945553 RepID=A0A0D2NDB9_HYPSF|nr:hypothetical protein HYPSUDRAFT_208555 [Hypholoma sublateritium FD-334 SS-4]KJA17185.1 hypothetical protein HYPSUDRAFT_206453 [Hypholoma sublateritium FD-334 SS-4]
MSQKLDPNSLKGEDAENDECDDTTVPAEIPLIEEHIMDQSWSKAIFMESLSVSFRGWTTTSTLWLIAALIPVAYPELGQDCKVLEATTLVLHCPSTPYIKRDEINQTYAPRAVAYAEDPPTEDRCARPSKSRRALGRPSGNAAARKRRRSATRERAGRSRAVHALLETTNTLAAAPETTSTTATLSSIRRRRGIQPAEPVGDVAVEDVGDVDISAATCPSIIKARSVALRHGDISAGAEYVQLHQQQQSSTLWPHSERPNVSANYGYVGSSILCRPRGSGSSSRRTWTRGIFQCCREWVRAATAHARAGPARLRGAGREGMEGAVEEDRAARSPLNLSALALALPSVEVETRMETNDTPPLPQVQEETIESDERATGADAREELAASENIQEEGGTFGTARPDTPIATQSVRAVEFGAAVTRRWARSRTSRGASSRTAQALNYPPHIG